MKEGSCHRKRLRYFGANQKARCLADRYASRKRYVAIAANTADATNLLVIVILLSARRITPRADRRTSVRRHRRNTCMNEPGYQVGRDMGIEGGSDARVAQKRWIASRLDETNRFLFGTQPRR